MNVLITGGSRGIGRACVELFSKEGYNVTFLYKSSDRSADEVAFLTGATPKKCDISSSEEVKRVFTELDDIDILINNAGISSFCFFDKISDKEWQDMININLSGAFYVSREACKAMIKKKCGRIISIGSMWGKVGASCEVHYSASKAGLRGLTLSLAKELAPSGITVNCIEPGVIDTEMNSQLSKQDIDALCEQTPLGRIGRAEEVAELALFLASDKASFITGQLIGIDGGYAI